MQHFRWMIWCTAAIAAAGVAAGMTHASASSASPQSYYLALGDSITYGSQPTKVGAPPSAFRTGYVDVFADRLRKQSPGLEVVNYGCPGESTVTFTRGGCPAFVDRIKLHDAFRGPQLEAALTFVRAHPEEVSPITVSLFGNDWFPLLLDTCRNNVACVRKRGPKTIAAFESRLTSIVQRLRAAAPAAEIIVTGAWNPDPDSLAALKPIYRSLEASIVRAATSSNARAARMLPVFNPPAPKQGQTARLCRLSFICSKGDPHPTDAGYRAIADAVMRVSG
jgi:lysophospholipase L1-like esterase